MALKSPSPRILPSTSELLTILRLAVVQGRLPEATARGRGGQQSQVMSTQGLHANGKGQPPDPMDFVMGVPQQLDA